MLLYVNQICQFYLLNTNMYPVFFFICCSQVVLSNWINLQNGNINLPAHMYKIQLTSFSELTGSLTWNQTAAADLDIEIYKSGADLKSSDSIIASISNDHSSQNFTYLPLQSLAYYIRVLPASLGNNTSLSYNLNLVTSSISVDYTGIFVVNYLKYNVIVIPNSLAFTSIAFKYETNSSYAKSVEVAYSTQEISLQSTQIKTLCNTNISNPDYLTLIITDTLASSTSLIPVSYNLSYYIDYPECSCTSNQTWNNLTQKCQAIICQNNKKWNNLTQKCQIIYSNSNSSESGPSVGVIIGVVAGTLLGILLVIIGVFLWRKQKKTQTEKKFRENKGQFNDTHNNIKENDSRIQIKVEQSCPICLGPKSNYPLKCKHVFHRSCIEEWLKKNNVCPLCRMGFSLKK